MRGLLWLLALTGCDSVLGFDPITPHRDAAIAGSDAARDGRIGDAGPHDEDGDGIDDSIDNCPGWPNTDQQDGDGDHVGDACDPHPQEPIDRIAYFSTLRSFSDWTVRSGTWDQLAEGVAQVDPVNTDHLATLDGLGVLRDPSIWIVASNLVQGGGAGQVDAGGVLITGPVSGSPAGLTCYEEISSGMRYLTAWDHRTTTVSINSRFLAQGIDPIYVAAWSSQNTQTGSPNCTGFETGGAVAAIGPADSTPVSNAAIGLYSYGGSTIFLTVMVIADQ